MESMEFSIILILMRINDKNHGEASMACAISKEKKEGVMG